MRTIITAAFIAIMPTITMAQSQAVYRPAAQPASCHTIAASVTQRATQGFQVLNTRQSCQAVQVLENAYSALDTGRMRCGRGWAQQLAMLEMDLLEALDYAGETCGMR